MSRVIKNPAQTYQTFVYNSSGSQSGNRYNSWSDLMTALTLQAGSKRIIFEQNETIPAGAWNLDYTTLVGNGQAYDQGGYTLTFPTGVTLSSWITPALEGISVKSTSNAPIITYAGGFLLQANVQVRMESTTAEFIKNTGGGQCIIKFDGGSTIVDGGYEFFNTTAGAFTCILVIVRGAAGNAFINNETLRSTNSVIFLDLMQSVVGNIGTFPSTHSNLTIGVNQSAIQTFSANLAWSEYTHSDTATPYTIEPYRGVILGDATAGNITVNLPALKGYGQMFAFKKIDTSTNTYTIDGNSTETIEGATTLVLSNEDESVLLYDAGDDWKIIAKYYGPEPEITDELTTITHTAPGTPDYAIAAPVDSSGGAAFGFSTADEFNTVMSVIANLQARNKALEDALVAHNLLKDAD